MDANNLIWIGNLEKEAAENDDYRRVIYTSPGKDLERKSQLVLMKLNAKKEIGMEVHEDNDQFIRVEKGRGEIVYGPSKEGPFATRKLADGYAVVVPHGTWHNIINTSKNSSLRLYTIYSPAHHPNETVQHKKPKEEKESLASALFF